MRITASPGSAPTLPPRFRRLLVAWAASLTGDGLRLIALPLLAVSVNPSPSAVAVVAVASALPWLLVAIPAGALVDRFDPARVMATAHVARALLTLALMAVVLLNSVSIAVLCAIGFAVTSAETFADGSAQSLLVRIVPHASLERANARFVTVETLALDLAGPLTAGALFVLAPWAPFALSAACFVLAASVIGGISTDPVPGAATAVVDIPSVRDALPAGGAAPAWDALPADVVPADAVPIGDALPADVMPADVMPADVMPADVVPADVVPADVVPADVVPVGEAAAQRAARSVGAAEKSAWLSIRAGLVKLFVDPVLRVLVITVAIMAIANAATDAVLVLYGTQTLGMSEAVYPTLLVAYSVGTLAAAALVGRANSRARGGPVMIIALFGISATMLVLGLVPGVLIALIAFAVMGLAGGTWNVLSATRRQRRSPREMIGRVSSAFRVVAWGVIPLGAALGGVIGERWGVSAVYLVAGGVIALLGVVVGRSFLRPEQVVAPAAEPTS